MSSPNVVFICKAGRMFYTVNKPLVPEWPCIIEVSYIYSSYTCNLSNLANDLEHCEQLNGFTPVWTFICMFNFDFWANDLEHWVQWWGLVWLVFTSDCGCDRLELVFSKASTASSVICQESERSLSAHPPALLLHLIHLNHLLPPRNAELESPQPPKVQVFYCHCHI